MSRGAPWKSWVLTKKQVTVTTWRFRLLVLAAVTAVLYFSYPRGLIAIGNLLLHEEPLKPAELILLENFNPEYAVFEEARKLVGAGYASRVLIPVRCDDGTGQPDPIEEGIVKVMIQAAGMRQFEILPLRHTEPVSLNAARQILAFLERRGIRSVLVVSPGFRSARSYLVYDRVLTPRGIRVECVAAGGPPVNAWWRTFHGIQDTALELIKLLYYRFWVL
jgi:hypothetical protein